MPLILQLFVLVPLFGFLISLLIPRKKEKAIAFIAIGTTGLHFFGCIAFIVMWLINGYEVLDIKHVVLYKSPAFEFFIDFYFDKVTAVYAFVGSMIMVLVSIFNKYYLHRDDGFKRFFNTLLLFFLGYNLVIFSGNFETLFIGWEILGFCSFLLIAFYRDRYLPVKNGLKVISVYRLGDVCLILALWACHHLFHENITFIKLSGIDFIHSFQPGHMGLVIFISIMLIMAAAAKSALFPFSSWLPRAMEGPTTSSAVFYGSLSVHLGAFLMLRTYSLWGNLWPVKIGIILLGLITCLVASSIARVQPTVKTQIAYSSISQIGLIFIEIALGLHILALIHFAGNAFLRTYQLLVSPSVLSYEIHDMVFNYKPRPVNKIVSPFQKIRNAVYILSIKEWNLDWFMYKYLWRPFKWIGTSMDFLGSKTALAFMGAIFLFALASFSIELPDFLNTLLMVTISVMGLLLILIAFSERSSSQKAWLFVVAGQCCVTLSLALNEFIPVHQIVIYMSGIIIPAIVGFICLEKIKQLDNDIALDKFHGYTYEKPVTGFIFLVCCLCLIGFPITPTFLGIDLLFTHIRSAQVSLIIFTSLSFIFIELAIIRIYARIFMGQHKRNDHPIAFRSS